MESPGEGLPFGIFNGKVHSEFKSCLIPPFRFLKHLIKITENTQVLKQIGAGCDLFEDLGRLGAFGLQSIRQRGCNGVFVRARLKPTQISIRELSFESLPKIDSLWDSPTESSREKPLQTFSEIGLPRICATPPHTRQRPFFRSPLPFPLKSTFPSHPLSLKLGVSHPTLDNALSEVRIHVSFPSPASHPNP